MEDGVRQKLKALADARKSLHKVAYLLRYHLSVDYLFQTGIAPTLDSAIVALRELDPEELSAIMELKHELEHDRNEVHVSVGGACR